MEPPGACPKPAEFEAPRKWLRRRFTEEEKVFRRGAPTKALFYKRIQVRGCVGVWVSRKFSLLWTCPKRIDTCTNRMNISVSDF